MWGYAPTPISIFFWAGENYFRASTSEALSTCRKCSGPADSATKIGIDILTRPPPFKSPRVSGIYRTSPFYNSYIWFSNHNIMLKIRVTWQAVKTCRKVKEQNQPSWIHMNYYTPAYFHIFFCSRYAHIKYITQTAKIHLLLLIRYCWENLSKLPWGLQYEWENERITGCHMRLIQTSITSSISDLRLTTLLKK